jgi:hypothetical protein
MRVHLMRALCGAVLMLTLCYTGIVYGGTQCVTAASGVGAAFSTVTAFLTLNNVNGRDPGAGVVLLPSVAIPADPMRQANVEIGLPQGADPGTKVDPIV